jgi:hypothetical protein
VHARAALARAETELLAALVAAAPPPAGFDTDRLRIQAEALIAKRAAVAARLRPDLLDDLGATFHPLFYGYARAHPRPAAGARADVAEFIRSLTPGRPSPIRRRLRARVEALRALPHRGAAVPPP